MDIIQLTSQDKLKTPTHVKQDSLSSNHSFKKTLRDQEKTPDTSSVKSAEIKELPSKNQNIEKETLESLDTSEVESKIPQNNNTDDLLNIRTDMANILPFASAVIEIQNPDQLSENMPNDLSFDRIFSYALNLDQDNGQKLALDQDQLKELGFNLENDVLFEIPIDALNLEQDIVSKASNANEMSVDHIIQSSTINIKPVKNSNIQNVKSSEISFSLEDEDSKDNLLEKHLSSATILSKNPDMMSKIFESSSFSYEQNKQFEEFDLNKNILMSQDNTSILEGQIFLKSEGLGQKMPASHTSILTPARQVEMEIRQAVHKGVHELEFDLNPLDLGKMNVRLNIDAEGQVKALIQAEKIETYEL